MTNGSPANQSGVTGDRMEELSNIPFDLDTESLLKELRIKPEPMTPESSTTC